MIYPKTDSFYRNTSQIFSMQYLGNRTRPCCREWYLISNYCIVLVKNRDLEEELWKWSCVWHASRELQWTPHNPYIWNSSFRFSSQVLKPRRGTLLYHFIQFERHASHPIFIDPANNFFSIYGDFGDLSEKQKSHVLFELNEMVQYIQIQIECSARFCSIRYCSFIFVYFVKCRLIRTVHLTLARYGCPLPYQLFFL